MSVGGTIAMGCALALFLAACFGWLARRSFKNFEHEAELNAPLIECVPAQLAAAGGGVHSPPPSYYLGVMQSVMVIVFRYLSLLQFRGSTLGCGTEMQRKDITSVQSASLRTSNVSDFARSVESRLGESKGDSEQQGGLAAENKTKTAKLSILSIFRRESRVQLTSSTSVALRLNQVTRRRLRAQRRKEWTRKIDVEGRAYWFRDSRFMKADVLPAAYVVAFEPARSSVIEKSLGALENDNVADSEEKSPDTSKDEDQLKTSTSPSGDFSSRDDDGSCSAPEPDSEPEYTRHLAPARMTPRRSTFGSVERCMAELENDIQELQPVLIPVPDTRVNALKLCLSPIGPVRTTSATASDGVPDSAATLTPNAELMSLASQDFPSKYAHFVMTVSSLLVPAEREHLRLNIERAKVFHDSMESLAVIPLRNLHSVMRINFVDESGIDAGGLHREWFVMLNEALVDPALGLFVCSNKSEQTYFLSPCSNVDDLPRQLLHLLAAGRLLSRALLEGSMLCFHLAPPLLKQILGYPLCFSDLEDLDPEVYTNLRWLLENDNVDSLGLDFTVTYKDGDRYRTLELVPGGSEIAVTDCNKREYVERKWQYLLVESVAPQLQVFLRGLYEIIPRELLLLFDPEEFDFLLCGSEEIDVDDWERNTQHSEGLHYHRTRKWFWELVREMPNEYRRRLLQFATGSSRVPLGGFGALTSYDGRLCPFTLKAVPLVGDGFIHSHACFNRLDLPLHVVREELKAVLYAILETEVYGFTTD